MLNVFVPWDVTPRPIATESPSAALDALPIAVEYVPAADASDPIAVACRPAQEYWPMATP